MKKVIVSFFLLNFVPVVWACKNVIGPRQIDLAINYETGTSLYYGNEKNVNVINGCNPSADVRYLRIASGVLQYYLNSNLFRVSNTDEIEFDNCFIKNSSHKMQSVEVKKNLYKEKNRLYRSCIRQVISDKSEKGIVVGKDQFNCEYKKTSKDQIEILGGVCYFKIQVDSEFSFFNSVRKECLNRDFYVKNNLGPRDISVNISYSTVKTYAENEESEMKMVGASKVHLSVAPYGIIPISEGLGYGKPDWPSTYSLSNIDVGKLELKTSGDNLQIKFPFQIDNTCNKKCSDGLCSGTCNYMAPVAANVIFSEILSNKKEVYLESGYMGGIAQPNWQGLLSSVTTLLIKNYKQLVSVGKVYQLEILFDDPKIDYMMLQKQFNKRIGRIEPKFGKYNGNEVSVIDALGNVEEYPVGPVINEYVVNGGIPNAINSLIRQLEEKFDLKSWPPFYEDVCDQKQKKCKKVDDGNETLHIKIRFKIDKYEKNRSENLFGEVSERGRFIFNKMYVYRKEAFGKPTRSIVFEKMQPEIKCIR